MLSSPGTVLIFGHDASEQHRSCSVSKAVLDCGLSSVAWQPGAHALPDACAAVITCFGYREQDDALRCLAFVRRKAPELPTIFVTDCTSEELVVSVFRSGVHDVVRLPREYPDLRRLLSPLCTAQSGASLRDGRQRGPVIVGNSVSMADIRHKLVRIAASDSNVLITGATGTGKELVAEMVHSRSRRHARPIVSVNCAALPESLIESELFGYERGAFTGALTAADGKLKQADGGTIFLDEIGDMSPTAQAKILRAIESRNVQRLGGRVNIPVDIRIIAATNQDLEAMVAHGHFRADLYFRLNVARVDLPPLRERKEDLPLLVEHYVQQFNAAFGRNVSRVTEEVLDCLVVYDWPGNIRELKNLIEAAFIAIEGDEITAADLPHYFRRQCERLMSCPQSERQELLRALMTTNWNKSRAAEKLHWSRMTLYRKLAKYGLTSASDEDTAPSGTTVTREDTVGART